MTAFPGGEQAVLHTLGYQPPLEVRDCAEHMEHQFTSHRSGVDIFFKADLLFFSVSTILRYYMSERSR